MGKTRAAADCCGEVLSLLFRSRFAQRSSTRVQVVSVSPAEDFVGFAKRTGERCIQDVGIEPSPVEELESTAKDPGAVFRVRYVPHRSIEEQDNTTDQV